MKLQFRLMSLALVVFASNVQATTFFGRTFDKQTFTNSRMAQFAQATFTKDNARNLFSKKNGRTAVKVAIPVTVVAVGYKLYKAGKFDSAIAKTKQAAKNAGSWINGHRKTTAALVVAALGSGYAYNKGYSFKNVLNSVRKPLV